MKSKYENIIKYYSSKDEADKDCVEMLKNGYKWLLGWYTIKVFLLSTEKSKNNS